MVRKAGTQKSWSSNKKIIMKKSRAYPFIFFILVLTYSCNKKNNDDNREILKLLRAIEIQVDEPSGLSFGFSANELLTVSDQTNKIYVISKDGEVLSELDYVGEDLEGITIRRSDTTIWVVEEGNREIIKLDKDGNELERFQVDIGSKNNKGLEGISYIEKNNCFYLVKESDPGLLINWSPETGVGETRVLNFALDYSGIYCDPNNDFIWIVSDESKTLSRLSINDTLVDSWETGCIKLEGVVVESGNGKVFCVSDAENKLFEFVFEKE